MSAIAQPATSQPRQGSPLLYFLVFMSVIFIGILIFAYVVTKRTHPVYLDEHGKPVTSAPTHDHRSGR
jgi:hypothetical protein